MSHASSKSESPAPAPLASSTVSTVVEPEWLAAVRQHVADLRFGVVQITVHAGKVVQVERTERFRFEPASPSSAAARTSPNPS